MDKDELEKTIKQLRRRQIVVRESIAILRQQWRKDQETLQELLPEAVTSGLAVTLDIDEP